MMAERSPEWGRDDIDFTIARGMSELSVVDSIREFFAQQGPGKVEIDRHDLNDHLPEKISLSKRDAEVLFTGLVLNDAATQTGSGSAFAEYGFTIDIGRATAVLTAQRVARSALEEAGAFSSGPDERSVELTGTFPPGLAAEAVSEVRPLSGDLRRLFFGANSIIRIANPYFDESPAMIGDIASLANRGVGTRILTRETESASEELRSTLNSIYEEIEPENRHRLQVRDLYEQSNSTGHQAFATHAKIAITDSDVCYLGSANLTATSLSSNFELGVLLRGETVDKAIDVFDAVFDFSKRVELPI